MHSYPGGVRTSLLSGSTSTTLRLASSLLAGVVYLVTVSKEVCAEYMLHALYTAPPGAYRYDNHGDDLKGKKVYHGEKEREALWAHTVEATGSVEA